MATTVDARGEHIMVINVYAPVNSWNRREELYLTIGDLVRGHSDMVLFGEDLNCSVNLALDRSEPTINTGHHSPALDSLLTEWGMVDALDADMKDALIYDSLRHFHGQHHTFAYSRSGWIRTSRLDRWYVTKAHKHRIRSVTRSNPPLALSTSVWYLRLSHEYTTHLAYFVSDLMRFLFDDSKTERCQRASLVVAAGARQDQSCRVFEHKTL